MATEWKKLAERVHHDPTPDGVHKLRVSTRKLRSAFRVMSMSGEIRVSKKLKHDLKEIGHSLGARRQLDVLIQDGKKFRLQLHPSRQWTRLTRKVVFSTRSGRCRRIRQKLDEVLKEAEKKEKWKLQRIPRKIRANLSPWFSCRPKNKKEWHQLRIQIKNARYALEFTGVRVPQLEHLQESLGRLHDLDVLCEKVRPKPQVLQTRKKTLKKLLLELSKLEGVLDPESHIGTRLLKN